MPLWIELLLIMAGVAILGTMVCVWLLNEGVKQLHDRVDELEKHPSDDPFKDFKK